MDKYAIVSQAIVPPQGKTLINAMMKEGATIPDLIKALRKMYGRPQLVIPILVQKVADPPTTNRTAASLNNFKERVLDYYSALNTHIGGDLHRFMPHFLRPFLADYWPNTQFCVPPYFVPERPNTQFCVQERG